MKKKLTKLILLLGTVVLLSLLVCNYLVNSAAEGKTFSDTDTVPQNRVGLVLGTSKKLSNGKANPYYRYRIDAAIALFKSGKIRYILVSGDNGSVYYNEPSTMQKDLIKAGIPIERIFLDYAGFRTLDSMVRAKVVFGLTSVTIISQKFHNERAIYIAEKKGLKAIGFNARDIGAQYGIKVQLREYFARVKVFIDLAINTQPKFYGDTIEIK